MTVLAAEPNASEADHTSEVVGAIGDIARRAATVTADGLDDLLGLIARAVSDLVGASRCTVYLASDDGNLHVQAGVATHGPTPTIGSPIGPNLTSVVRRLVELKEPVVMGGMPAVPGAAAARLASRSRTTRVLGVPVLSGDHMVGVLLAEGSGVGDSPADVALVETFAGLAALAVRSARHSGELANRVIVIERQKGLLESLIDAQQLVERAVRRGAGTPQLVRVLAGLVGKPVAFFDTAFRMVAVSEDDPTRRQACGALPAAVRSLDWVRRTIGKLDAVERTAVLPPAVADGLGWRHLVCAVAVDGTVEGYVVVSEIGRRLSINDVRLTDHVATIVGMRVHGDRRDAAGRGMARQPARRRRGRRDGRPGRGPSSGRVPGPRHRPSAHAGARRGAPRPARCPHCGGGVGARRVAGVHGVGVGGCRRCAARAGFDR